MIEIKNNTQGLVGYLHEVECNELLSTLIFQLPRKTDMLNKSYVDAALETLHKHMPDRNVLVIGCDVNVYELAEADSII